MTLRGLINHFQNRMFELAATMMMLSLSLHIVAWPGSIGASSFRLLLVAINAEWLAIFFAVFGTLRMAALIANGAWVFWGPILRMVGATGAAMLWGEMCLSLFLWTTKAGTPPSPGIPVYFMLTVFELLSAYRASVQVENGRRVLGVS